MENSNRTAQLAAKMRMRGPWKLSANMRNPLRRVRSDCGLGLPSQMAFGENPRGFLQNAYSRAQFLVGKNPPAKPASDCTLQSRIELPHNRAYHMPAVFCSQALIITLSKLDRNVPLFTSIEVSPFFAFRFCCFFIVGLTNCECGFPRGNFIG